MGISKLKSELEAARRFGKRSLRDIAVLIIETGMRPEELYRLRVENVNLNEGHIFNPKGKTKAARQTIPLTKRAVDLLRARLATVEGEYVFPLDGDPSKPMRKINYAHNVSLKASGCAHSRLYVWHTFATRAVEAGVDLVTLAAMLGHSKIQTVLRYARPQAEHKTQAIRKMEAFQAARQMEQVGASAMVN